MQKTGIATLALVSAFAAGPALAQNESAIRSGSPSFPAYLFNSAGGTTENPVSLKDDRRCLVRKATGRSECRTMAEWRRIASELGKAEDAGAK